MMNAAAQDRAVATILLVDDHPIVRDGLTLLINAQDDMTVCGAASSPREALAALERHEPDLVIVDITFPEGSGLELIKDIAKLHRKVLILALSMHDEKTYAERSLSAGARGYVMKHACGGTLVKAIRRVLGNHIFVSDEMKELVLRRLAVHGGDPHESELDLLSDRELEVFELIGRGHSTRDIADELHLSIRTIQTHRERVKRKLIIESATELQQRAVLWIETGKTDQPRKV